MTEFREGSKKQTLFELWQSEGDVAFFTRRKKMQLAESSLRSWLYIFRRVTETKKPVAKKVTPKNAPAKKPAPKKATKKKVAPAKVLQPKPQLEPVA